MPLFFSHSKLVFNYLQFPLCLNSHPIHPPQSPFIPLNPPSLPQKFYYYVLHSTNIFLYLCHEMVLNCFMFLEMKISFIYIVLSVLLLAVIIPLSSGGTDQKEGKTQVVKYQLVRPSFGNNYGLFPGTPIQKSGSGDSFQETPMEFEEWMKAPENWKAKEESGILKNANF